jgi:hypothetical protein
MSDTFPHIRELLSGLERDEERDHLWQLGSTNFLAMKSLSFLTM